MFAIEIDGASRTRPRLRMRLALVVLLVLGTLPLAYAEGEPKTFSDPEDAVQALIAACEKNDDTALKALVGGSAADLVQDGRDPVIAQERRAFAKAAKAQLGMEWEGDDRLVLVVGRNKWPLPIPLAKAADGRWYFDVESGREEVVMRRIGRNEHEAIRVCRLYAAAQIAYTTKDRDGDGVFEYAQKIVSSPGKQDGLYWEPDPEKGIGISPVGPYLASLDVKPKERDATRPWSGYYWKVLKSQGPNAPGGAHDFTINGNMIAGFALVGVPAEHGKTGVMTFLVSHHGKVLEKDLGEDSLATVKAMTSFDPDDTWSESNVED